MRAAPRRRHAEVEGVLVARAGQSGVQQREGGARRDDLRVAGDVIAVRVRDERARLARRWVEPEIVRGQFEAALVAEGDQWSVESEC